MRNYLIELWWVIALVLLAVIQISFISSSILLHYGMQAVLVAAIMVAAYERPMRALFIASIAAYIMDLNSALPFGIVLIATVGGVVLFLFLRQNVFKNRALHSLVIGMCAATIAYHLLFFMGVIFSQWSGTVELSAFQSLEYIRFAGIQTLSHAVIGIILYYAIQVSIRLTPAVANRRKYVA
ncbi:MAG: hypothetical protein ABIG66_04550 [Candidatus Kerfeldbacteria bacterium]